MNSIYFIFIKKMEQSDTTTLVTLDTLVHFRHSLRFTQAKAIISDKHKARCVKI